MRAKLLSRDIQPYLEQLKSRELTNRAVAEILGVSEEHVSRTLKALGVKKDVLPGTAERELRATRRQYREHVAKTMPPKQAARAANCSLRTIYRLRNKP